MMANGWELDRNRWSCLFCEVFRMRISSNVNSTGSGYKAKEARGQREAKRMRRRGCAGQRGIKSTPKRISQFCHLILAASQRDAKNLVDSLVLTLAIARWNWMDDEARNQLQIYDQCYLDREESESKYCREMYESVIPTTFLNLIFKIPQDQPPSSSSGKYLKLI